MDPLALPHPRGELFPHRWIHGVHGHAHVGAAQIRQCRHMGSQLQTVAGHAKEHVREPMPDQGHGFQGLFHVGEGSPGPATPATARRALLAHGFQVVEGLAGG